MCSFAEKRVLLKINREVFRHFVSNEFAIEKYDKMVSSIICKITLIYVQLIDSFSDVCSVLSTPVIYICIYIYRYHDFDHIEIFNLFDIKLEQKVMHAKLCKYKLCKLLQMKTSI